jgi:hypothetical protein
MFWRELCYYGMGLGAVGSYRAVAPWPSSYQSPLASLDCYLVPTIADTSQGATFKMALSMLYNFYNQLSKMAIGVDVAWVSD